MDIFVALSDDLHISPEARFVLQALLYQEQDILGYSYKTKSIAKLLCLTERLVREASLELVKVRLLEVSKSADKVGRPGQNFVLPFDRLLHLLPRSGGGDCFHQGFVKRLFSEPDIYALGPLPESGLGREKSAQSSVRKDGRPVALGARGRLWPATRMLLAALLVAADQCGFVSGLGEAKLRTMTGMTALALKHQMKRLISLGFIRCCVPGLSSAAFSGSKVCSVYYMNLDHPQLGCQKSSRALAVYVAHGPRKFDTLALGLPPHAERALKALGPATIEMLYHKLANCTSHLLSLSLGDIESERSEAKAAVFDMIVSELKLLRIRNVTGGDQFYWEGTHENFLAATCEWAEKLQKRLFSNVWPGYTPEWVRLIPAPDRKDGFRITTVMVHPAPPKEMACTVLLDVYKGHTDLYGSEAELGLELRYELGLLTAPA